MATDVTVANRPAISTVMVSVTTTLAECEAFCAGAIVSD